VRIASAILVLLALRAPFPAGAQEGADFTIRFYNEKIYFLGDEIMVEAAIINNTRQTLRFSVADNRFYSFDFEVRTTTNLAVNHAKEFTTRRNSDQPVFFRDVSLQPGERYAIVVDLTKYTGITDAGLYIVQGQFFPELWRGKDSQVLTSNKLTLNVKPPVVTAEMRAVVEAQTGALIVRQPLPPDQVVSYTIQARQKTQWDRFFLYLDLESLLRRNADKDRVWRRSSQQAQQTMLDQFRQQLMSSKIDQDIDVIPTSFEIQKTSYTASEGTVQVLERFKYTDYTELKQYIYSLKKQDEFWIIMDYEVKNLGTE
jgi:hypothetical protein